MKTIGLIGGITPESTIMYYQTLNKLANDRFGGSHSAKLLIHSFDFGEISKLQTAGRWDLLNDVTANAAVQLEKSGASCIVICANTMHLTVEAVRKQISIPIIHIAEATAEQIQEKKLQKVLLLGTKYTMEKTFYSDILKSYGIETIIPNEEDRSTIHNVIYKELSRGILNKTSKEKYIDIIHKISAEQAVEGVILGCTEIPLLIQQDDVSLPVFDTTTIHAKQAFSFSIV